MERVGMLEGPREGQAAALLDAPISFAGITLLAAPSALQLPGALDLLAISPRCEVGEQEALPACRLLLLPGGRSTLIRRLRTDCVMSYGTSPKDSLTLSSVEPHRLTLSIQRDLVTLHGGTVERQELSLSPGARRAPMELLFRGGLLLLLGVPPEQLPDLL